MGPSKLRSESQRERVLREIREIAGADLAAAVDDLATDCACDPRAVLKAALRRFLVLDGAEQVDAIETTWSRTEKR